MDVYLVGGAVRDELLGREVKEHDWVVVGGSVAAMLAAGYRQVGRDFPVFLHPQTSEEYALARTERKTGPGHTGFEVHADTAVTLEDDLARRDLTINAMARTADGCLIDPYGGQADLATRRLRHVSAAFTEDPLRVFRVARFAAQLPGFEVAPETVALIRQMAGRGVLEELSAERVWAELAKALLCAAPERFVAVLEECDSLEPWFTEFGAVQPIVFREGSSAQRYAAFCSGLSLKAFEALNTRLKTPRQHGRTGRWLIRFGATVAHWRQADAAEIHQALSECRAFKPDTELADLMALVETLQGVDLADLRARVAAIIGAVRAETFQARGLEGAALGNAMAAARLAMLNEAQN
jgi:tRNA nucleotidyltransferase (CCA-adding enzyme)